MGKLDRYNQHNDLIDDIKSNLSSLNEGYLDVLEINEKKVPASLKTNTSHILELKKEIQKNIWLIGQRLDYILKNELYKEGGHSNFEDYANKELDFNKTSAFKYISIFRNFELRTCGVVDSSKLYLLTSVKDEEKRRDLVKKLEEEDISFRKLQDLIKEFKNVSSKVRKTFKIIRDKDKHLKKIIIDFDSFHSSETNETSNQDYDSFIKDLETLLSKYHIRD